ncbi:MAG TPA: hypothetical protein VF456_17920 [Vicinamibacterales bacterium]
MTHLVAAAVFAIFLATGSAQSDTPIAEVAQLRMYSSFWENLHHFLYVAAWARRTSIPVTQRLAMPLPQEPAPSLTAAEQAAWAEAVDFYDRTIASRDLLFDDELTRIKIALGEAGDTLDGAPIAEPLRAILLQAAPIYRKYWWDAHDAANRAWIEQVSRQTSPLAESIIDRITRLYRVKWFTSPVRVDVVRVGKSLGAYTSVNPTPHIVVASGDSSYAGWSGTEMLFHESSHALIFDTRRAIDSAVRSAGKNPRDLWHVVLFYVAGEVTRQQLGAQNINYVPYLYANGLFDSAWPAYRDPIEQQVRPFVDGRITYEEMAANLARALR